MGLITKTVKIKWHPRIKKHYESIGYVYTKMGDEFEVRVEDLTKSSEVKIECLCDNCGKRLSPSYGDYNKCVKNDGKYYCTECSLKLYGRLKQKESVLNKTLTFEQYCIENDRQDLILRWDKNKNKYSPNEVCYKSGNKYWFKCLDNSNHKSELKQISSFTSGSIKTMDCIQCNSIAQWLIDNYGDNALELYWDYNKNTVDPWALRTGSEKEIWIFCQQKKYHDSRKTTPNRLLRGDKCPYCSHKNGKVHPLDSLGQYIINNYGEEFLWKIWSKENTIDPFTIAPYSGRIYLWNCLDGKHEPFKRSCKDNFKYGFRCPKCVEERNISLYEEKTRLYLQELGYEIKTEYNCSLILKNPKDNKSCFRFDNEIILKNKKHLMIEVHGEQHYNLQSKSSKWLKEGQTPEEYLHERKLIDRYKRIKCIQVGYEYLEIPYTAFDKKETYKNLIDNKIKEILDELD